MIFLTFLLAAIGAALLVAALASDAWIVAQLHKIDERSTDDRPQRLAERSSVRGQVRFGLFRGRLSYSYGIGERERDISSKFVMLFGIAVIRKSGTVTDCDSQYRVADRFLGLCNRFTFKTFPFSAIPI